LRLHCNRRCDIANCNGYANGFTFRDPGSANADKYCYRNSIFHVHSYRVPDANGDEYVYLDANKYPDLHEFANRNIDANANKDADPNQDSH
jgi:hypothetical protein